MIGVKRIRRVLRAARRPDPDGRAVTPADVRRAYQFFLGREPEDEAVVAAHVAEARTLPALLGSLAAADEFIRSWDTPTAARVVGAANCRVSDEAVIRSFAPYTGPGRPGFVTDYLGTRTRTAYIAGLERCDGLVEGYPIPANFHATAVEWAGAMRAVLEAAGRFVAVELGAGWGPWLVSCAAAAARVGIRDVRLVGVEGSPGHCEYLRQHFRDNGLDPDAHTLLHGVAAAADGEAEFPADGNPAADYGATLADGQPFLARVTSAAVVRTRAYSLPTLLAPFDRVDLVHIDIQGTEAEVVAASRDVLRQKVRRLVIGTHGRLIEQRLFEDLTANGWELEAEEACRFVASGASLTLACDGCQVWRNHGVG